jgi:Fur family ferric uptake transcriptional regulator
MTNVPRNTKQKSAISAVFSEARRPLTPQELLDGARIKLRSLSLGTVYRVVRGMVEEGSIVTVSVPGAPDRYETRECAAHHHHHFHCDSCGRMFDVPGCGLRIDNLVPQGFTMKRHEVVLYGSCRECA